MRQAGNQHAALQDEANLLDDYLERYPDRAIRLFEVCHKVVGHVVNHVKSGALPQNDNLIGACSACDSGGTIFMGPDPAFDWFLINAAADCHASCKQIRIARHEDRLH